MGKEVFQLVQKAEQEAEEKQSQARDQAGGLMDEARLRIRYETEQLAKAFSLAHEATMEAETKRQEQAEKELDLWLAAERKMLKQKQAERKIATVEWMKQAVIGQNGNR